MGNTKDPKNEEWTEVPLKAEVKSPAAPQEEEWTEVPVKKKDESDPLPSPSGQLPESTVQPSASEGGTSGLTQPSLVLPSWMQPHAPVIDPGTIFASSPKQAPADFPLGGGPAPATQKKQDISKEESLMWDRYASAKSPIVKKQILDQIQQGNSKEVIASRPLPDDEGVLQNQQAAANVLAITNPEAAKIAQQENTNPVQSAVDRTKAKFDESKTISEAQANLDNLNLHNSKEAELKPILEKQIEEAKNRRDIIAYSPEGVADNILTEDQVGDYGKYLHQLLYNKKNDDPKGYKVLAEKADSGALSDEEKHSLLNDAIRIKAREMSANIDTRIARGDNKLIEKYGAIATQAHQTEAQMQQIQQAMASVDPNSPEHAQMADQYQKLQIQGSDLIDQLHAASPEEQKKIAGYINDSKQAQKASDDYTSSVMKFPALVDKLNRQVGWNYAIADNAISGMAVEIPSRIWNGGLKFVKSTVESAKMLADLVESPFSPDAAYSESDRMMDSFSKSIDHYSSAAISDKPMVDPDGTWHPDRIVANVATMATDMYALLYGARKFESAIQGVQNSEKLGLFASNFMQSVGQFKEDAKARGMNDADQYKYATTASLLSSALFMISPNAKFLNPEGTKALGEAAEQIMNKNKVDWKKILDIAGVQPTKEAMTMLAQNVSEKLTGALFNDNSSIDPNKKFSTSFTKGEFYQTGTLAAATNVVMRLFHGTGLNLNPAKADFGMSDKLTIDNAKYLLGSDLVKTTQFIEDALKNQDIAPQDAAKLLAQANTSATLQGKMPDGISESKRNQIFPLLEEKSRLEEDNKRLDPLFVKKNDARIAEIEGAITEIFEKKDKEDASPTTHPGQEAAPEDKPTKNVWVETDHAGNKSYFKLDQDKQPLSITEQEYSRLTKEEAKLQEQKQEQQTKTTENEKVSEKGDAKKEGSSKESGSEESSQKEVVKEPAQVEKPEQATTTEPEKSVEQKTEPDAVQEQGAGEVLQREQEVPGEKGGERQRMEQGQQGEEAPGESAKEEKVEPPKEFTGRDDAVPPIKPSTMKLNPKDKAVLKRVSDTEGLSAEAKRKVDSYGLEHDVYSNKEADEIAKTVVEKYGHEKAVEMADDRSNGITGSIRTMIYANSINHLHDVEKAATTPEEKDAAAEGQAEYADKLDQYARDSGRAISALQRFYELSPLGFAKKAINDVKVANGLKKEGMGATNKKFEQLKKELDKAKAIIEKMQQEVKTPSEAKAKKSNIFNRTKEEREKVINDLRAQFRKEMTTNVGLNPKALAIAIKIGAEHLASGIDTFGKWSKQMIKEGLTHDQAKEVWDNLEKQDEFKNVIGKDKETNIRKEQMKVLEKMFPKKRTEDVAKRKSEFEKMIDAFEAGATEGEKNKRGESFEDLFYEKFGLLNVNKPEFITKMKEYGEEVAKTPPGSLMRTHVEQKMMDYVADEKIQARVAPLLERGMAHWYANILSSYETHLRNIKYNALSTYVSQIGLLAERAALDGRPKDALRVLMATFSGVPQGMTQAKAVVKRGFASSVEGANVSNILERQKGGIARHIFKFPGRFLRAADVFFTIQQREGKATSMVYEQVAKEHPEWSRETLDARVNEVLGNTSERKQQALEQAQKDVEKVYGEDWESNPVAKDMVKMRQFELVEQSRPEDIREESIQWAKRALLNSDPQGMWKGVYDMLNAFGEIAGPLKLIVPFTKVPINLAARMMERTPVGYINAIRGKKGWPGTKYEMELTPDERKELYIKATNYTVGVGAMAAYVAMTGGNSKDDAPLVITGRNTGNYQRNQELVKGGGLKEYSVYIKGHEIMNYKDSPLAALFAPVGYMRDYIKYGTNDGYAALATNAAWNYMLFVHDQSSVKGLNEFMANFQDKSYQTSDPEHIAAGLTKTAQSMLLPLSGLLKAGNNDVRGLMGLQDKKATEWYLNFLVDVPFMDEMIANKWDHLGRPVKDNFNIPLVPSAFDVEETKDPFYKTFKEKKYYPNYVKNKTVFKNNVEVDMSGTDLNDLNKIRGDYALKMLNEKYEGKQTVFDHMKTLDDDDFKKAMNKLFHEAEVEAKIQKFGAGISNKEFDLSKKKKLAEYNKMLRTQGKEHIRFLKGLGSTNGNEGQ